MFKNLLNVINKLLTKKSGTSENDILVNAYAFFDQDEGVSFNLKCAWRLLKCELKWMRAPTENSPTRINNSASSAYTSSSNSSTPLSYEYNSSFPMKCPMRQKA